MTLSTIASVASFSAVLAETFAAVGLSTIIPNAMVMAIKAAKTPAAPTAALTAANGTTNTALDGMFPPNTPIGGALALVRGAADSINHIDLLIPKKATIDAEFEFQASESYSAGASLGAAVNVVTVSAGYSALYETSSKNKVSLHVEFGLVGIDL